MAVGARRAALSSSDSSDLLGFFLHTIVYGDGGKKSKMKNKHPVNSSCIAENILMMREGWRRMITERLR